jgi:hypothetical protein
MKIMRAKDKNEACCCSTFVYRFRFLPLVGGGDAADRFFDVDVTPFFLLRPPLSES